jgi:DNA-3-methyladenine glycosylase II
MGSMMAIDVKAPFSFSQTLAFIGVFPAARDVCVLTDSSVTTAVSLGGRAHAFKLHEHRGNLVCEVASDLPAATQKAIAQHATRFIGASDDLEPLYAAANGDAKFTSLVHELRGLHHVRFPTLADAVVYSIMMQRAPMPVAAALQRKFLAALGHTVVHEGHTLVAMPTLAELAELPEDEIAKAIRHKPKAARIASVVREAAKLDETFLRTAPYEQARDALLAINGIGPFAAAAILLRGLGRMDELPWMRQFEDAAHSLSGKKVGERAIAERYGRHVGYWSFYVMTGLGRRERAMLGA